MKIKTWMLATALAASTMAHAATNDLTGLLQQGLFEEEANRNLDAAISDYQSLASAFDKDRQLAATAIFRLGECYRKLGKTNEAVVQYQRIVKEFSDQQTLVTLSRQNLAGLRPPSTSSNNSASLDNLRLELINAQRLVRSVDGTIESAHYTNRGPVLVHLFQDDKSLQFLADDQRSLLDHYFQLLKNHQDSEAKTIKEQIDAKQKTMEARADELAAKAHDTANALEKEYRQRLADGDSSSASPNEENNNSIAEAQVNLAALQAQLLQIENMSHDQLRIFVQQNYPNPVLTTYLQELDLAQQKLIELKVDYTPDHPKYKSAQELVDDLNAKIDAQVSAATQGLRNKLSVAQVQLLLQQKRQTEISGTSGASEQLALDRARLAQLLAADLPTSPRVVELQRKVDAETAALKDLTAKVPNAQGSSESATTDEEQTQIRNIQTMIQNSPDLINAPSSEGETPLQKAATAGQLIVAKYLLDHGASADTKGRGQVGDARGTPLFIAANYGHKTMVELLLSHGADVNGAQGPSPIYAAVSKGFTGVVEVLLAHKADVNATQDGLRVLHTAVHYGRTNLLKSLIDHGADVNAVDVNKNTPLQTASIENQPEAARILIAAKANVNAQDNQGNTALHDAAKHGADTILAMLLDSGASVDITNNIDSTPLFIAVNYKSVTATRNLLEHKANPNHPGHETSGQNGFYTNPTLPIYLALQNTNILELLLDAGADVNGNPSMRNPLFIAIGQNGAAAIQLLLQHGSNPNARDTDGSTALSETTDLEIARLLIDHRADVNARDRDGRTSLIRVTGDNAANFSKLLLEAGAKTDLQETNGNTALHYAVFNLKPELVATLLEHKANPNVQNDQGFTPLDIAKAGNDRRYSMLLNNIDPSHVRRLPSPVQFPPPTGPNGVTELSDVEQKVVELLTQAGGLANLPKRDRIEVRRASETGRTISKDSSGRNRYSLLETIAMTYGLLSQDRWGEWHPETGTRQRLLGGLSLGFPNFKQVIIYRRTENSAKQTAIKVNIDEILNSGDCSRDVWLEWGDIIEISEVDHPVDETWTGLPEPAITALIKCVSRQVTLKIKGDSTTLKLATEFAATNIVGPGLERESRLTRVSFMLRSVLDNSKLIRVSSDLSRVKVTRQDPLTKKTLEWTLDCTNPNQSSLWLRDGDVVEVPEK